MEKFVCEFLVAGKVEGCREALVSRSGPLKWRFCDFAGLGRCGGGDVGLLNWDFEKLAGQAALERRRGGPLFCEIFVLAGRSILPESKLSLLKGRILQNSRPTAGGDGLVRLRASPLKQDLD